MPGMHILGQNCATDVGAPAQPHQSPTRSGPVQISQCLPSLLVMPQPKADDKENGCGTADEDGTGLTVNFKNNFAKGVATEGKDGGPDDSTGGVGKEEVAKAIHRLSKRSTMPFVAENMSAITKELFESKMFGHVKGSFTGATENHQGLFKKAHCGTLFMDEIGDMPLDQQAKLLRAIQEGEFFPVGSSKIEKVNVRIIAATNKELEKEVLNKTFRQDLFYRLNIINIKVPPLRDRIEDIRPLVESFKKKNKIRQVILMEVLKKFESYAWPGNVRELYSELLRLTSVFQDEPRITLKHLDSKFFDISEISDKQKMLQTYDEFHQHSENTERKLILEVVKKYRTLRLAASEGLKIPYSTLQSRIKKLNLNIGGGKFQDSCRV